MHVIFTPNITGLSKERRGFGALEEWYENARYIHSLETCPKLFCGWHAVVKGELDEKNILLTWGTLGAIPLR